MKRNRRSRSTPAMVPTPERLAKGGFDLVDTERAGIKAHRVQIVSQYDLLWRHRKLTRDEHAACEHFERQYRAAFGADCLIARYDKGVSGGAGNVPQHALAEIRHLSTQIGPHWHWLIAVIIDGRGLRVTERWLNVRNGEGLPAFKAAIRAMTEYWQLPNEPETKRELSVDTGTAKRDNVKS